MSLVAVSWLALHLAPSESRATWAAVAIAAYTLPGALGSVLFGRWLGGRGGAQLAAWDAVLRTVLLALIPVAHLAGVLGIWLYTVLLGLSALLRSWGSAGRFTLIAELLPPKHRLAGNALIGLLVEASVLVGPALAAVIIGIGGPVVVIAIDAATFAVLAITYLLAVPKAARAPHGGRPALPVSLRSHATAHTWSLHPDLRLLLPLRADTGGAAGPRRGGVRRLG